MAELTVEFLETRLSSAIEERRERPLTLPFSPPKEKRPPDRRLSNMSPFSLLPEEEEEEEEEVGSFGARLSPIPSYPTTRHAFLRLQIRASIDDEGATS